MNADPVHNTGFNKNMVYYQSMYNFVYIPNITQTVWYI